MILRNRARIRLLLPAIGILAGICVNACATMMSAKDPEELARTLDEAIVFAPRTYYEKYGTEMVYGRFKEVKHKLSEIPRAIIETFEL